jgi:predicted TIM-barrel fold metal-dependent hydrolase
MLCPKAFLNEIFVLSDTDVACLSGYPAERQNDQPSIQARGRIKEIIDQLSGSPRLVIHANVRPIDGAAELDAMARDAAGFPVVAWKTYPEAQGLDTDAVGRPFIERARQIGIKIVAAHRGIGSDGGVWTGMNSPRDVAGAAKASPDFKFLVYHSGWQSGVREDHPFNVASPEPLGIDRLIKAVLDNGLGPTSNLYAELGTTWFNLRNDMAQAAHALGKLLKYLGPDRILWGTDCVNNGNPQPQIEAFRTFQIPEAMQMMYGYPALTAETKRKILGENAAALYGVDIQATRRRITADDINRVVLARRDDPGAFPRGPRPYGPRTRREYLAFLRWNGGAG